MFLGVHELAQRPHDCLILPAGYAGISGGQLVATRGIEQCVQLFPPASWATLAGQLSALPLTARNGRQIRRMFFGAATPLVVGPDRAIQLPHHLVAYAGLHAGAVLVGMNTFFEIWSSERWHTVSSALAGEPPSWLSPEPSCAIPLIAL